MAPTANNSPKLTLETVGNLRSDGVDAASANKFEKELIAFRPNLQGRSTLPLYRRISGRFREWIESGRLQPYDRISPERRITELLGVSRRTVRAALKEMIEEGYLSATHGCGTFVMEPPYRREQRFLSPIKFQAESGGTLPGYYELVHRAEEATHTTVHYKFVPDLSHLRRILQKPPSGYDGMLLYRPAQQWIDALRRRNFASKEGSLPLVVTGRVLDGTDIPYVSPDHAGMGREATRSLLEAGHRRIGYVGGDLSQEHLRLSREGYLEALSEAGLKPEPDDQLELHSYGKNETVAAITPYLEARGFTAVVVAGSAYCGPFEHVCEEIGIEVPGELSAVFLCEEYIHKQLKEDWTAQIYPDDRVARRSLEVLRQLGRARSEDKPVQEVHPGRRHVGSTCKPPR